MVTSYPRQGSPERFLFDLFLKLPTYSIRKALAALKASRFGPQGMGSRKITKIRKAAQAHLDGLPGTEADLQLDDAHHAVADQIEADMFRERPASSPVGLARQVAAPPVPAAQTEIHVKE